MQKRLDREGWRELLTETGEQMSPELLSTAAASEYLRIGKVGVSNVQLLLTDALSVVQSGNANRRVYFELPMRRGLAALFSIAAFAYTHELVSLQVQLAVSIMNNVTGENTVDGYDIVRDENERLLRRQSKLLHRLERVSYASGVLVKMAHAQFELL